MKHLKKFESFKVNEGILTTVALSIGVGGGIYIVNKIKNLLEEFITIYASDSLMNPFLKKIENMERSLITGDDKNKGEVLIEKNEDETIYTIIIKNENGDIDDSITVDMKNELIYYIKNGKKKVLLPSQLPLGKKEDHEKLKERESKILDKVFQIISNYSK